MTEAAAVIAWLGGSIVLLSDGCRGLALGIALIAAGFAGIAVASGQDVAAIALLAGGATAGAVRLRRGPEGWGLVPAGSTPRLILAVVSGLVSLWIAAAVATGDGGSLRFAVLAVLTLLLARLLQGADPAVSTAAASGIAIALGAGTLQATGAAPAATCMVAAVVAVGLQALPQSEPHGA